MKLCKLIPRKILENLYGINIPRPGEGEDPDRAPTGDEFLSAYSSKQPPFLQLAELIVEIIYFSHYTRV